MDHFWLAWPDKCTAGVTRKGEHEPCDKPAVAVAVYDEGDDGEWEPHAYPVCKHHARGTKMMPLKQIMAMSFGVRPTEERVGF